MTDPSVSGQTFDKTTDEIAEFCGRELKMGNLVKRAIDMRSNLVINLPVKPKPDDQGVVDEVENDLCREKIKQHVRKEEIFLSSMQKAHAIIYGQCADELRAKLEAFDNHDQLADDGDPIGLLKNVRTIMLNYQTTTHAALATYKCKKRLYKKRQKNLTVAQHYKEFKSLVDMLEFNGGSFGHEESLIQEALRKEGRDMTTATLAQHRAAQATAHNAVAAVAFIQGANAEKYSKLKDDLENSFTQNDDKYPKDLLGAYNLLTNWKQTQQASRNRRGNEPVGDIAFTTLGQESGSDDSDDERETTLTNVSTGNEYPHIRCYNCQEMGHCHARTHMSQGTTTTTPTTVATCRCCCPRSWRTATTATSPSTWTRRAVECQTAGSS